MKAIVMAAFLLFAGIISYGQEKFLAWNASTPLQWDDFYGKAADTSHYDAESFAEVQFTYRFNNNYDFFFDVKAVFNRKTSWIKNGVKSQALLKHEQTHFDIAELYARKLKSIFYNSSYSSNFHSEVSQIFNEVKAEYHQMQQQYDEETNHSTIVTKQKEWEGFINEELEKIKNIHTPDKRNYLLVKNK